MQIPGETSRPSPLTAPELNLTIYTGPIELSTATRGVLAEHAAGQPAVQQAASAH
ncbi:hypothetical protein ACFUTU_00880 [Arthrobacter sp. NPDC057388]|uniref:hypothetical protein n=1 Tax=Arthrobacter sp. NPDC057388 TaxID=3346116 RepID=UPI00363A09BE